jgi:hypothetical protein
MWQGSFPRAGLCCPRPSSGTTTPSATLPARRDFPFQRLYAPAAPGPQRPGPGRASPVPVSTLWPSRSPYPGGFPGRLHVQVLGAFHGLRREFSGSAPSCPIHRASVTRLQDSLDAAGWPVASPKGAFDTALRRWAFPPNAGSLLPGLLAATRTGPSPAGEHGLTRGPLPSSTSSPYPVPTLLGTRIDRLGCAHCRTPQRSGRAQRVRS